jgi:prepilin-type N-terminal cleavage/methylation domain-containing protein
MRKGVTVIEILVVLAIVAVLAAVLIAALAHGWGHQSVDHPAYKASCMSNVKNIGLGFAMYQNDHEHMPTVTEGAATGALGMGFLWEGGYIDSNDLFSCPENKTEPEWEGIRAYRDALARGFNSSGDRWHAGTLGYDYDNTMPHDVEPLRVILADKTTRNHGSEGSVALFADKHAEYLKADPTGGAVPNMYLNDTDIYRGVSGGKKDCFLNGPDTDDR